MGSGASLLGAMSADDKATVKDYFNTTGFERWRRIYGNEAVNRVQRDIRTGHQQTIDTVLDWFHQDGELAQRTVCDAGCGVGSLGIPLARAGARVFASDISDKMVAQAQQDASAALADTSNLTFRVADLEALRGRYHTVACLDVLIHYPPASAAQMVAHLASLSESRLILSFAPKTPALSFLKKIGEFFPGPSKTTRAYQHREADIVAALRDSGLTVRRQAKTSQRFYFARILEAVRDGC